MSQQYAVYFNGSATPTMIDAAHFAAAIKQAKGFHAAKNAEEGDTMTVAAMNGSERERASFEFDGRRWVRG